MLQFEKDLNKYLNDIAKVYNTELCDVLSDNTDAFFHIFHSVVLPPKVPNLDNTSRLHRAYMYRPFLRIMTSYAIPP